MNRLFCLLLVLLTGCTVTMQPPGAREPDPPPALPDGGGVAVTALRCYPAGGGSTVIVDGWVGNPHPDRDAYAVRVETLLSLPDGTIVRGHDTIAHLQPRGSVPFRVLFARPDLAARHGELTADAYVAHASTR